MTAMSGAACRAGFGHYRQAWVYNVRIPRAQKILGEERPVHTAEHLASAIFFLGVPVCQIPRARLWCDAGANGPDPVAVIHPVASAPDKTWPADRFLAIAVHLKQNGMEPIFIGSATDDLSAFAAYRVVGGAPLSQVKSLLASASLFVGNDSGPAHMAAAFGLPVVVLFGSSDPAIWGPWGTTGEALTAREGIAGIAVSQVTGAIERVRVLA
jgi:ADP-heptose:LPS heptosyltransferase